MHIHQFIDESSPLIEHEASSAKQAFASLEKFAQKMNLICSANDLIHEIWYGFRCSREDMLSLDFSVRAAQRAKTGSGLESLRPVIAEAERLSGVTSLLTLDTLEPGLEGDWADSAFWPLAPWYGTSAYLPECLEVLPEMDFKLRLSNRDAEANELLRRLGLATSRTACSSLDRMKLFQKR